MSQHSRREAHVRCFEGEFKEGRTSWILRFELSDASLGEGLKRRLVDVFVEDMKVENMGLN